MYSRVYAPIIVLELIVIFVLAGLLLGLWHSQDTYILDKPSIDRLGINLKEGITYPFVFDENKYTLPDELSTIPVNFGSFDGNAIVLKPNAEQLFDGFGVRLDRVTHIKINSDGFRDREYTPAKPNNTFRIVVLGDSMTFGWGVEQNETYAELLETMLNHNLLRHYEVLNFGVPGHNTELEIGLLKKKAFKYDPDMILIGYFPDDIRNTTSMLSLRERIEEDLKVNSAPERVLLSLVIAMDLVDKEISPKPFDDVWSIVENPLNELGEIARVHNTRVAIVTVAYHTPSTHIDRLKDISQRNDWNFINLNEVFKQYRYEDLILHPQDEHYKAIGHRIIAEEIYEHLAKDLGTNDTSIKEMK